MDIIRDSISASIVRSQSTSLRKHGWTSVEELVHAYASQTRELTILTFVTSSDLSLCMLSVRIDVDSWLQEAREDAESAAPPTNLASIIVVALANFVRLYPDKCA